MKHDCTVPNTSAKSWTCPACGRSWKLVEPLLGADMAELWHGKANIRNADGSKIKSWWQW